jgi:hypothetical protein
MRSKNNEEWTKGLHVSSKQVWTTVNSNTNALRFNEPYYAPSQPTRFTTNPRTDGDQSQRNNGFNNNPRTTHNNGFNNNPQHFRMPSQNWVSSSYFTDGFNNNPRTDGDRTHGNGFNNNPMYIRMQSQNFVSPSYIPQYGYNHASKGPNYVPSHSTQSHFAVRSNSNHNTSQFSFFGESQIQDPVTKDVENCTTLGALQSVPVEDNAEAEHDPVQHKKQIELAQIETTPETRNVEIINNDSWFGVLSNLFDTEAFDLPINQEIQHQPKKKRTRKRPSEARKIAKIETESSSQMNLAMEMDLLSNIFEKLRISVAADNITSDLTSEMESQQQNEARREEKYDNLGNNLEIVRNLASNVIKQGNLTDLRDNPYVKSISSSIPVVLHLRFTFSLAVLPNRKSRKKLKIEIVLVIRI